MPETQTPNQLSSKNLRRAAVGNWLNGSADRGIPVPKSVFGRLLPAARAISLLADWGSYLFIVGVVMLLAGGSSAWVDCESGRLTSGAGEGGDAEEETQDVRPSTIVPSCSRP